MTRRIEIQKGQLQKRGRGLFAIPERTPGAHEALAKVPPNAVVCLIFALRWHQITAQQSPAVWLVRMSGAALEQGGEWIWMA